MFRLNRVMAGLVGMVAVFLLGAGSAYGQGGGTPLDVDLVGKADSLRREIEKRAMSEDDKRDIRDCARGKAEFLKQARASEPEHAKVDKAIMEAKLAGVNPDDPTVMALLEKKFAFEKAFDERYTATAPGRKCVEGEARRRQAVAAALEKDKTYQDLLKRIAASPQDPL